MEEHTQVTDAGAEQEARRAFLMRCGRFAAVTPPAIATLLAVSSVPEVAHASTIGRTGTGTRRGDEMGMFRRLFGEVLGED
jgi:hypothetical protein